MLALVLVVQVEPAMILMVQLELIHLYLLLLQFLQAVVVVVCPSQVKLLVVMVVLGAVQLEIIQSAHQLEELQQDLLLKQVIMVGQHQVVTTVQVVVVLVQ
tara:strand:+ start:23 stop:325 length:303 start_codon:yes stop_codon:yes gene_type:complete